jgi:NSS family neurotransmitter:Na+ symporter
MYLVERKKMKRKKATYSVALIFYVVGLFALLSNTTEFSALLTFGSKNIFDWFDFISAAILMPLGGILVAIFVGYIMDKEVSRKALVPHIGENLYQLWLFIMRFVAPLAIFLVMLNEMGVIQF